MNLTIKFNYKNIKYKFHYISLWTAYFVSSIKIYKLWIQKRKENKAYTIYSKIKNMCKIFQWKKKVKWFELNQKHSFQFPKIKTKIIFAEMLL